MATPAEKKEKKTGISVQVDGTQIPAPKDHFTINDKTYGERHFIRNGEAYTEVTKDSIEPVRPNQTRQYQMNDSGSFIAYVKRYGDAKTGIISYGDNNITMFFSEANRKEFVQLNFKASLERQAFLGERGTKTFEQKELIKALETFGHCVEDQPMLLANIERLKMEAVIEFESNVANRDTVFVYSEKGGSQTARIPKKLVIRIPYFEGAVSDRDVEIDCEITMPKSSDNKPMFTLTDPRHERTRREAFDTEITHIQTAIPAGWMLVHGKV